MSPDGTAVCCRNTPSNKVRDFSSAAKARANYIRRNPLGWRAGRPRRRQQKFAGWAKPQRPCQFLQVIGARSRALKSSGLLSHKTRRASRSRRPRARSLTARQLGISPQVMLIGQLFCLAAVLTNPGHWPSRHDYNFHRALPSGCRKQHGNPTPPHQHVDGSRLSPCRISSR